MRSLRGRSVLSGLAILAFSIAPGAPAAAVPLAFPTDQVMVPVAVGTAFALPALLALLYVSLGWLARATTWIMLAAGGIAVAALAIELVRPGSMKAPLAWVLERWLP